MPENYIRVAVYANEVEAELAQATLAAGGIESFLQTDDSGGMLPALQQDRGVEIFVPRDDVEEAQKLLNEQSRPTTDQD
jgi:hypothetical protein